MPMLAKERNKVFICYSYQDRLWLERLQVHLKPLECNGLIELWSDEMIQPGSTWRNEIRNALNSTRVAVFLISPDLIASDLIVENELLPLLTAAETDGVKILPLIVRPTLFERIENLARYQSVNPPSEPLITLSSSEQEKYFLELALAIREIFGRADRQSREEALSEEAVVVPGSKLFPSIKGLLTLIVIGIILSVFALMWSLKSSPHMGYVSPTPTPTPAPTPASYYEEKLIAEARKKFGEGKIAFKPPEEMIVSKTETLEARITHQQHSDSLVQGLKGGGKTKVEALKVSCRMKVTLTTEKDIFNITSITPNEIRLLDPQEPYSFWKWDITPQKSGVHEIHLVAEAIADIPKLGERPLYVKTFDYTIRVKVNKDSVLNWIGQYWQYVLGSIVIPLTGWLWSLYSKRKEKASNERKPPDPPRIITP